MRLFVCLMEGGCVCVHVTELIERRARVLDYRWSTVLGALDRCPIPDDWAC